MNEDAHARFRCAVNLEEWISAVVSSAEREVGVDEIVLPPFPSLALQEAFTGQHGSLGMETAALLYRLIHTDFVPEIAERPLRILDFGCGWGRMLHFFLRDTPGKLLYGVDPLPMAAAICRANMPGLNIVETDYLPPLPFRSSYFDLIVANSVFSHLPELSSILWVQELFRIIKPSGALVLTTHAPELIDDCVELAKGEVEPGKQGQNTEWLCNLAASWFAQQPDKARRFYRDGKYVYAPTGGAGTSGEYYGDTIIPQSYIEKNWSRFFSIQKAIVDRTVYWQSVYALRRCE